MSTPPSNTNSTYLPGSPTGGMGAGATGPGTAFPGATSIPSEDLSNDQVIKKAARADYQGVAWPTLGGIPLLARLGEGGMGTVYYGYHVRLDQEVAVKVLPFFRAAASPHLVQRFYREARMAAKVHSPHLVGVFDINEENGLHYIVMEFVKGLSGGGLLKRAIVAGQIGLNEADALDLCIAATEGIAAAHAQGIIHRDIKPDNILVPEYPPGSGPRFLDSKLADLGLARGDATTTELTGSNAMMGSPGFLAPEQAMDARTAGKRSDVFSMSATLYALLAGKPPFTGPNALAAAYASVRTPHRPVRELRADTSPATAALIDRCLAKKPDDRYADGAALLQALRLCRQELGQPETVQQSAIEQLTLIARKEEVGRPYRYEAEGSPGSTPLPQNPTPVPPRAPVPMTLADRVPGVPTPPPLPASQPIPFTQPGPAPLPFKQPAPVESRGSGAVLLVLGLGAGFVLLVIAVLLFAFSGKIRQWAFGGTVPPPPPSPMPSPSPAPPSPPPFAWPTPSPVPSPVPVPIPVGPTGNNTFEGKLADAQLKLGQAKYDAALDAFTTLKRERPDSKEVADGLTRTGKALLELGDKVANGNGENKDPVRAVALYTQAAQAFRECDAIAALADALYRQALNLQVDRNPKGDWAKAVELYMECLRLDVTSRNEAGQGDALCQLGWCHCPGNLPEGTWPAAYQYYQQASGFYGRQNMKKEQAICLWSMGWCIQPDRNPQGDWFRAVAHYEAAAQLRGQLGDKQGQGDALHQEGWCLSPPTNPRANVERAAGLFEQAAKLRLETGNTLGRGWSLFMQGWCLQPNNGHTRGDYSLAAMLHGQAVGLFITAKDRNGEASALQQQAICIIRNDRRNLTPATREIFQRAAKIFRELNDEAAAQRVDGWLQ